MDSQHRGAADSIDDVPTVIETAKRLVGPRATVQLRCRLRGYGRPRWGNLRRTTPFSSTFGFDRGTPIDRHYLHRFLDAHRHAITGRVLEVQTDSDVHDARYPLLTTIVCRKPS